MTLKVVSSTIFFAACCGFMIYQLSHRGSNRNVKPGLHAVDGVCKFGSIPVGNRVRHAFRITNSGTDRRKILKVTSGCSCTSVELPNAPKGGIPVEPGQTMEISATFEADAETGYKRRNIVLRTDDPADDAIVLTFEGDVIPLYLLEPAYVQLDSAAEHARLRIKKNFDGPYGRVRTAFCNIPGIRVSAVDSAEDALEFDVTWSSPAPSGVLDGYVCVELSQGRATEVVFASVRGELSDRYSCSPTEILIGEDKVGKVRLSGFHGEEISADSIVAPDPRLKISVTHEDEQFNLTVHVDDNVELNQRPIVVKGRAGNLVVPLKRRASKEIDDIH